MAIKYSEITPDNRFDGITITSNEELADFLLNHVDWATLDAQVKTNEDRPDQKYVSNTLIITEEPELNFGGETWTGNRVQFNMVLHAALGPEETRKAKANKSNKPKVTAMSFGDFKKRYQK